MWHDVLRNRSEKMKTDERLPELPARIVGRTHGRDRCGLAGGVPDLDAATG